MSEKIKKAEKQTAPAGGGSVFDGVKGLELPENKEVNISSGPYAEALPVAGTSVGEVRRKFKDRFDIDDQAVAIVNGKQADENVVLKAGESLIFVRHAGEKGAEVLFTGKEAVVGDHSKTMPISDLMARCGPGLGTGDLIIPDGVKAILSRGNITLCVWEQPPRIHQLSWIAADSPIPFGPGTKYRNVRIALPYLVIVAVFGRDGTGMPNLIYKDECFFRTEPLKSLDDTLLYPGLLNCSSWGNPPPDHTPLSWICTQHLKRTPKMQSKNPGDRFCAGFEAVRYCLLATSFNLSSEHHEGNSWYGRSKKIDPRIASVEEWEKNTAKDPLFVLDVPWIPTKHSVRQLAERIFRQLHAEDTGVKTADDLARIIING